MTLNNDPILRLATYGTLRRGEALDGWFADPTHFHREAATGTIDGSLYYHPYGEYPVVVLGTGERTIVEIVSPRTVAGLERFEDCLDMEENAGYEVVLVDVDVDGETIEALVCAWPHSHRGARIATNDWTHRFGVADRSA